MLNTALLLRDEVANDIVGAGTTGTFPNPLLIRFQELKKQLANIGNDIIFIDTMPAKPRLALLLSGFFIKETVALTAHTAREMGLSELFYEAQIVSLGSTYTFRNPDEIKTFLINHREIFSIVRDAPSVIEEFFGHDVDLSLEIVNDPEAADVNQLFGYICAKSLSPQEALERLSAFDTSWFLEQYDSTGGLLNFNLE